MREKRRLGRGNGVNSGEGKGRLGEGKGKIR